MKKRLISMLAFSLFTLFSFGTAFAATESPTLKTSVQNSNIGFIDVDTIMKVSPKVKVFQDQLNKMGEELSSQLEAERANLTPDEFYKKRKARYSEFARVRKEKESEIDSMIHKALEKVTKEKNLVVVLYKNMVAFAGVDVTLDVINKMGEE